MEILKKALKKLSSRKFMVSVAGVAGGILLILNGQTTEGATTICTAVVAYLAAEGLIDWKAVGKKEGTENDGTGKEKSAG